MLRKILLIAGIVLLFFVALYVLTFLLFPTDSVRHLAEKMLEKQLKQEQTVEIENLRVSPLLNLTVKGFSMKPRVEDEEQLATAGGEYGGFWCEPSVPVMPFTIKEAVVRPKVFKTIKGTPEGAFALTLEAGTVTGDLKTRDKVMELNVEGKEISLNEMALLSNLTHMQIYGMLSTTSRVVMEKGKLVEVNASLESQGTAMCPKRLKLNVASLPYLDLPFIVFGDITADIEVKKDHLTIHSLKSTGPDIQLDVKGDVWLKSKDNPVPRLEIEADILPSKEWVTDNNMKVIYQLCEKHDDGSIYLKLSGTTKKLKHDCGTPIPEPVEVVEKKAEPVKKEVKVEEKPEKKETAKEKEKKEEPPPEAPPEDRPPRRDRADRPFRPDGGPRMGGFRRGEARDEGDFPADMPPRERRQIQDERRIDELVDRDIRSRGKDDFSNHEMGDFRDMEGIHGRDGMSAGFEQRKRPPMGMERDDNRGPRRRGGRGDRAFRLDANKMGDNGDNNE